MNAIQALLAIKRFGQDLGLSLLAESHLAHRRRLRMTSEGNPVGHYVEWLKAFHQVVHPKSYLEIGVASGQTLALSQNHTTSVGVDPAFKIVFPIQNATLYRLRSDDYFRHLSSDQDQTNPFEMVFIDGLHEWRQAVRDLLNSAHACTAGGVILIHDVVPMDEKSASPTCKTILWPGDVFKMLPWIHTHYPEVRLTVIRTAPTGLAVITGIDRIAKSHLRESVLAGDEASFHQFDSLSVREFHTHWLPKLTCISEPVDILGSVRGLVHAR